MNFPYTMYISNAAQNVYETSCMLPCFSFFVVYEEILAPSFEIQMLFSKIIHSRVSKFNTSQGCLHFGTYSFQLFFNAKSHNCGGHCIKWHLLLLLFVCQRTLRDCCFWNWRYCLSFINGRVSNWYLIISDWRSTQHTCDV